MGLGLSEIRGGPEKSHPVVGGGSVINGAYPVKFLYFSPKISKFKRSPEFREQATTLIGGT